jgi:hypothetical protein
MRKGCSDEKGTEEDRLDYRPHALSLPLLSVMRIDPKPADGPDV